MPTELLPTFPSSDIFSQPKTLAGLAHSHPCHFPQDLPHSHPCHLPQDLPHSHSCHLPKLLPPLLLIEHAPASIQKHSKASCSEHPAEADRYYVPVKPAPGPYSGLYYFKFWGWIWCDPTAPTCPLLTAAKRLVFNGSTARPNSQLWQTILCQWSFRLCAVSDTWLDPLGARSPCSHQTSVHLSSTLRGHLQACNTCRHDAQ